MNKWSFGKGNNSYSNMDAYFFRQWGGIYIPFALSYGAYNAVQSYC